jgi:small subunit ribosomal protein S2
MSVEVKKEVVEAVKEDVKAAEAEKAVAADQNVMAAVVHDPNAPIITLKKLLEAGVHYGHQTRKWNPKMGKYIYCPRNGIYIIDLNKSRDAIETSYEKLKEIVTEGGKVLFVGTKIQAKPIVEAEAIRSGSFYVTNRWLGGVLTNFKTIQTRIRKLKDLEDAETDGSWDKLSKKEVIELKKLKAKLSKNLEGIKEMRKLPNAIVVVDPMVEHNAIKEASKLNIPVFAICDTNCDPDNISYVIPGNDDATKSIQLIVGVLSDAVCEAKGGLTNIAYTKDEGEEVSMKDAIRQADRENALRLAARREMQRERLEKEKARRDQYESRFNKAPSAKSDAPVAEGTPVEEKKTEDKKEETK